VGVLMGDYRTFPRCEGSLKPAGQIREVVRMSWTIPAPSEILYGKSRSGTCSKCGESFCVTKAGLVAIHKTRPRRAAK
jgi:hypothetical protein